MPKYITQSRLDELVSSHFPGCNGELHRGLLMEGLVESHLRFLASGAYIRKSIGELESDTAVRRVRHSFQLPKDKRTFDVDVHRDHSARYIVTVYSRDQYHHQHREFSISGINP